MEDKFDLHGWISKVDVSSHEDSASEFCCTGSIFSMKLVGFMSKAIKLLLIELVGQCRNIFPLAFSAFEHGKCCEQYIPALTFHSIKKSILLSSNIFFLLKHPKIHAPC